MLFADDQGRIYDHPILQMVGFDGCRNMVPGAEDLLPLPEFSKLFYLPGCPPLGYDPSSKTVRAEYEVALGRRRIRCHAVAAFPEPGYARTLLPAADYTRKNVLLPLWAYTAVGFTEQGPQIAAFQVEYNPTWDPRNFDDAQLTPALERAATQIGSNPLLQHLKHCALHNHCFAAKNLFLRRWEAPLPVSRRCNARCLGCLSLQGKNSCTASHQRVSFRPTMDQVLEVALPHLEYAENPIVSFGQGCEGEPLTEAPLIADSIRAMRRHTPRGTINLNTNGSMPDKVADILDAGLDSIRVSLNSARPKWYQAYYRPKRYDFFDVVRTLRTCTDRRRFTMINYLIFPGITDAEEEIEALLRILDETAVQFIHFKNLCIDPELYLRLMPEGRSRTVGIRTAYDRIRKEFPDVSIGYFNQRIAVSGGNSNPPSRYTPGA